MHDRSVTDVIKELKSSEQGLSDKEAHERLKEYGLNELQQKKKINPVKIFLEQFHSFVVYILIGALAISLFLHFKDPHGDELIDAIVIGIIIILNALFGFIQEYRAEKSIEALKKLSSLKATVLRDKKQHDIDAKLLVPGDVVLLETGDKVPADSRIIELVNFQTAEAPLTGESLPVKKDIAPLKEHTQLADRINMVFAGTVVTAGKAHAIVTGTGMKTEIGKIATMIEEASSDQTPLQKKLDQLGRWLGVITLIVAAIVFVGGTLKGGSTLEFFIVAVSLAVAAIPEGLPAVVTIGLAIGVQRMIKRNALIRKLPSVETLGSTTVICTDKTGTLTKNEMTVKKIFANGKIIDVEGSGYENKGDFLHNSKKINPKELELLLRIGALNNDAAFDNSQVIGDPTEAALIVSAKKAGIDKDAIQKKFARKDEIPFSSERKIMTTFHKINAEDVAYVKGAPEILLKKCNSIYENGRVTKLTEKKRKEILETNKLFAKKALRVLGFAYKTVMDKKRAEKNLTFVGLQGMIDPPRSEVKEAVQKCKKAGIKVVVITGDNQTTAVAVANAIGIEGKSMTGEELAKMDEKDLEHVVEDVSIYARVNPEHKNKIVGALKAKGHIVAMTGDGVNDAPAIKKADIGISMGVNGTDVAKEAADMILVDDNFASIVNAVEEGRGIYDNIKKFVEYLLSSNLGEVLTIFVAIMIGLPLPLIAIMLLWVNLVTDGLPALALAVDPADPNIMEHRPRKRKDAIVSKPIIARMVLVGVIMMVGTLWVFSMSDPQNNLPYAQTMAFVTLMLFQMFNVLNCRSEFLSIFRVGWLSNPKLLGAIFLSVLMQIMVIHTPLNVFFKTVPLSLMDWLLAAAVASSVFIIVELYKLLVARVRPDVVNS